MIDRIGFSKNLRAKILGVILLLLSTESLVTSYVLYHDCSLSSHSFWRREPLSSIQPEIGFSYIALTKQPELSAHKHLSPACVLENGVPFPGLGNALHDDIRHLGGGRYSFWYDYVFFSASDNSDPRANGRRYEIFYPTIARLLAARVFYVVARPFRAIGLFGLFDLVLQWGKRIASQIHQFPKKLPNTLWIMVYCALCLGGLAGTGQK